MKHLFAAVTVLLTFFCVPAWAHPSDEHGSHTSHSVDPAKSRLWTNAKTGEVVRGAFLAARQETGEGSADGVMKVSIERESGDVVVFPLADLADADRAEAQKKIDEVKAINERLAAVAVDHDQKDGASGPAGKPTSVDRHRPPQAVSFDYFAPFVKTRWDDHWLYVECDGLPHAPWTYPLMVGIKSWQQQVPLPQAYTGDNAWRIPLKPELADKPISAKTALFRGAIALAANGVPIFNALNNRGDDTYKVGELDDYGGHSGRGDDYHYHIAPLAIQKIVGKDKPIAYALDGFPLYGLFDPTAKRGDDKACPLGGTEKLDELNGHFGATTKGPGPDGTSTVALSGLYHYHASLEYPYINGGVRGKVTVKDDQIDPQPRASPVRQWLQPLRGAAITGFKTLSEKTWSLEYKLADKKHLVNFRIEGTGAGGRDAKYVFDFIDPNGTKKTETYQARSQRTDRAGRERPDGGERSRGNRPPRDDGPTPRPPADGEPEEPAAASIVKPLDGFVLTSPDVTDDRLSIDCTCDGKSRSPSLAWEGAPEDAKAFAVVMHHVTRDNDTHVYMVVASIPAAARELKGGDASVGTWGQNTVNRKNAYAPPCSKGPGDKVYSITLYALSAEAPVPKDKPLTRESLLAAITDTTLATATLDVKYARASGSGNEGR